MIIYCCALKVLIILQDELGIIKDSGAVDINLGCSGYVYGLSIANGLISAGSAKNVLLVTAETYSKFIHPKDKKNKSIFGDGATSTLITANNDSSLGPFIFGTDGKGRNNLIVKTGAFRNPDKTGVDPKYDNDENIINEDTLFMDGHAIFNFSLREVPITFEKLLTASKLRQEEIDLFIFHQANEFILEAIRKKCKIPEEKFYKFFAYSGNTVSSTIPIALCDAIQKGKVQRGDKVMLMGFGVGLSWAGVILNY